MLIDFHGLYTERSVGSRLYLGRESVDWLRIVRAWGKIHDLDYMQIFSVECEV